MNSNKPILALMEEFLENQDIRDNSRKKYRDNLLIFIHWLTINGDVVNPVKKNIIDYKTWLGTSGKSPSTIDNYLAPVRRFFAYLAECDIHKNVTVGVKSPARSQGFTKDYLRVNQVNDLLRSINRSNNKGLRDYAIINLMVRTGMRCIEVSRANVKDLRIENESWVLYIQGKGRWSKDRAIGVTQNIVGPIAQYIGANLLTENSPMFLNHSYVSHETRITSVTISKLVKSYLRKVGIDNPKLTAHSLRHTAAITALKNGADALGIKSMLGHRRLETSMIYQRALEEERGKEGTAIRLMDNVYQIDDNRGKIQGNDSEQ